MRSVGGSSVDRTEVRVRRGNQDTRRPRAEASGGTSPAGTLISGFWPRELKGSSVLLLKPQAAWAVCHGSAGGPVNLVVQGGRPLPAAVAGHLPWALGDIRTEILTSPHPCSRRLSILPEKGAPLGLSKVWGHISSPQILRRGQPLAFPRIKQPGERRGLWCPRLEAPLPMFPGEELGGSGLDSRLDSGPDQEACRLLHPGDASVAQGGRDALAWPWPWLLRREADVRGGGRSQCLSCRFM